MKIKQKSRAQNQVLMPLKLTMQSRPPYYLPLQHSPRDETFEMRTQSRSLVSLFQSLLFSIIIDLLFLFLACRDLSSRYSGSSCDPAPGSLFSVLLFSSIDCLTVDCDCVYLPLHPPICHPSPSVIHSSISTCRVEVLIS